MESIQAIPLESNEVIPISDINSFLPMIERVVMNPSIDISKMEKLLDMRNKEILRQAETEFNKAFAEMQPNLPPIPAKGIGHNDKKYARKQDMNLAVNPILAQYGFSLSFSTMQNPGTLTTRATLRHKFGHSIFTEITLKDDSTGNKNAVQAVGSAESYGERYTMKAILNLTIIDDETDDDAKAAMQEPLATHAQREVIMNLYKKLNQEQQDNFDSKTGGVLAIKKADVEKVISKLNKSIKENK